MFEGHAMDVSEWSKLSALSDANCVGAEISILLGRGWHSIFVISIGNEWTEKKSVLGRFAALQTKPGGGFLTLVRALVQSARPARVFELCVIQNINPVILGRNAGLVFMFNSDPRKNVYVATYQPP